MVRKSSGNFFKSKNTTILKARHRDNRADEKKDKKTIGGCHL